MADEVIIRAGERNDCSTIISLIQELADFEKMPNGPKLTIGGLERDGFDTVPPMFRILVAEDDLRKKVIGFALFYNTYSTWTGKCLYLEDLYVTETYRSRQIGSRLFCAVAKLAYKEGNNRLDFQVLEWNPARSFYEQHGAVDLTVSEKWHYYRLSHPELAALVHS